MRKFLRKFLEYYQKGINFKHTNREDQHIRKKDQHILLLSIQIRKKAEKQSNNTQIKLNKFVCLKVKKHILAHKMYH